MPLPTPRADETEQDFVNRFMGNDTAISDFPDEKQRAAVAYRTYRDEDEEMEELELPGVSILEEGEAKGHDLFVDKVSLEKGSPPKERPQPWNPKESISQGRRGFFN